MITSAKNPKLQKIRRLILNKKDRTQRGEYVLEGVRILEEAVKAGVKPMSVLFSDDLSDRGKQLLNRWSDQKVPMEKVLADILKSVAGTEHTQGIIAEFSIPQLKLPLKWNLLLVLDQLRDPGNVGTLLRTAWAFRADGVILTNQSADLYNPKTLRAAMGAHFHIPTLTLDWNEIASLAERSGQLVLTDAEAQSACWNIDFHKPTVLAIGGEADGLQKAAYQFPHIKCLIPMDKNTESLNAASAGSILMYEIARQRTQ